MALRKEIYLSAAEAISAGLSALGNFSNLEMANDQVLANYQNKLPALAKLHVVADLPLLQATLAFTGEFNATTLKAFAKRQQLLMERQKILVLDQSVSRHAKDADGFLEMIKQHNINAVDDDKKWNALNQNFDFSQKRRVDTIADASALREKMWLRRLEFARDCVLVMNELSKLVFPILAAIRNELELPLAFDKYEESVQKAISRQRSAADEFFNDITALVTSGDSANNVARSE